MEVRSIYKYARISPKKARDVAREIQGLAVSDALDTLNFTPKKAAFLIGKTLKSAVANAENNHLLAVDSLRVKEANISEGPTSRRFMPRARGSAGAILKRTSHIYITLTDEVPADEEPARTRGPKAKKKPAAPKQEAPRAVAEEAAPEESEEAGPEVREEAAPEVSEKTGEEAPVAEEGAETASTPEEDKD